MFFVYPVRESYGFVELSVRSVSFIREQCLIPLEVI